MTAAVNVCVDVAVIVRMELALGFQCGQYAVAEQLARLQVKCATAVYLAEDEPFLYFFVTRKAESDLCEDYRLEIENKLGFPTMGRAEHFADVFEFLMKFSAEHPITLFIDEFQEFFRVNKSVYSEIQRIWDIYSPKSRMNLVVCGSIYSMMSKIFKDKKEPLYNRQTRFMTLRPFSPAVLKEILTEYHPGYKAEDLLALY